MHACSLHVCNHALLHLLFIVAYPRGSVMVLCACNFVQIKPIYRHGCVIRSAMLYFKAPEWFPTCRHIASHSYMSSYMAF
jgi:hypothetical protein